eukprot:3938363-Pyramimonas_sp.AAC.1
MLISSLYRYTAGGATCVCRHSSQEGLDMMCDKRVWTCIVVDTVVSCLCRRLHLTTRAQRVTFFAQSLKCTRQKPQGSNPTTGSVKLEL